MLHWSEQHCETKEEFSDTRNVELTPY